ncbi:TrmB family transcriptional regulator [Jannaschia formosa]|uniref:TrmB family transcriptional regulator n=1 Tax=Jannaschia formosa TaxID=2259592 RepID=UPI000E1BADDC|nr:TrmB family transcriptional regulator [Jannaschia formosa]TFL16363.1 TrmB family transcriptional regulator [Jannaschia formosa]
MGKKRDRVGSEGGRPDDAAPSNLIFMLERLNFSEVEARVYVALFSKSPATAYQIAQMTGLPRANVYNTVGGLTARGALQQVSDSPARYIPREPADFFASISRSTSDTCENVVSELRELAVDDGTDYVATYSGRTAVDAQVRKMIASAKARIYIKTSSRLLSPYESELLESAERGVLIHIVAADPGITDLPQHENIVIIPHEGTGVATGKAVHHLLTVSADADGMLIAALNGEPTASYTRNDAIVYTVHTMVLHEIYLAEIYKQFGPNLEERFGVDLKELRRRYRPENLENRVLARGSGNAL